MLTELKRQATEAAESRGHKMAWAAPWHGEGRSLQNATCQKCGLELQINSKPLPNQIAVGGEAVALNCK